MGNWWKFKNYLALLSKWIPRYLSSTVVRAPRPYHIFFCMVDHYEPGVHLDCERRERARVGELLEKYPLITANHSDSGGVKPQRTWFFPPHFHRYDNLRRLVGLCERQYGEIELHLHHGKIEPDDPLNFKQTIAQCLEEYGRFGIFGAEEGRQKFAFIHGDWALDNSREGHFCGLNNELKLLGEAGCYADFTFPCFNEANPRKINSIYYAADDVEKAKSHNSGVDVRRGGKSSGDLMLVQGPLYPHFTNQKITGFRLRGDEIDGCPPVDRSRMDAWVKTGIHVKGQRNLVFVKTHTHGAMDAKAVLGAEMEHIFSYLESKYNDKENYVLHYVTAREMYNVIKAVEAGEDMENPDDFRDYKIRPPAYDSSVNCSEGSATLKRLVAKTYLE